MFLENAFNLTFDLQSRDVTLHDLDSSVQVTVKAAPSNYFRSFSAPEEMVIEGREWVFSKKNLESVSAPTLRRGVRIIDSEIGDINITEVREMIAMGTIIGYRVRTG